MYIVMCLRVIYFHIDLKSTHFNYTHDVANLETHGRLIRIIVLINTKREKKNKFLMKMYYQKQPVHMYKEI